MSKKFLTKNEFRLDLNPKHFNSKNEPHPAYISGRKGHKYYANEITHSRSAGELSVFDVPENPNKTNHLKNDNRKTRLSVPFWQNENLFSNNKMTNFRFSNSSRKYIKKKNKKFKQ